MNNDLTLIIPAKNEKESLPFVINELNKLKIRCKLLFIVERTDLETIKVIRKFKKKIIFQTKKGYGDALITGIKNTKTKFFCIFNADGSFNPRELKNMLKLIKSRKHDFIFASRYEKNCSSEDDTFITKIGNFFFTKLGNIFFKLEITDILYTFVLGKTKSFNFLKLKENDFKLCVELPIKSKKNRMLISTSKSHERQRYSGIKKVNALRDGFLILKYMIKKFLLG
jgi:glycosyltransferase involved in cell wall biosynthesis